jgi:hypothetical protein
MLSYSVRPSRAEKRQLSLDEDIKLRNAFGRFAKIECRQAGIDVVSTHYQKHHWFHCDCRPDQERAPTLFLVSGNHIQREPHDDPNVTAHDDGCEFARDPDEQKKLVRSYTIPDNETQLSLVRKFSEAAVETNPEPRTRFVSTKAPQPALATVLRSLLRRSKLNKLYPQAPLRGEKSKQVGHLCEAAQEFTLAPGRSLNLWLATSLDELYWLKEKLNASIGDWERPYGLFLETFDRIENNTLYPTRPDRKPIRVEGSLHIFGEGKELRRPPYLVIGLLSQPDRHAKKVELIKAYAHPCVAWNRLMLVDSRLERETLKLLIACRDRLAPQGIKVSIEKPLFDAGPPETDNAREVCIPDFLLRARGPKYDQRIVVVETMGYDDAKYRERKRRMRPLFEQIGPGPHPVPVIEHDRYLPNKTQGAIDAEFCEKVCMSLMTDSKPTN